MLRLFSAAGLCAAFVLLSGASLADEPDKKGKFTDPEKMFKQMDTNNDGKLSKEELKRGFEKLATERGKGDKANLLAERLFEKLDENKDGFLSLDEYKKLREKFGELKDKKKGNKEE